MAREVTLVDAGLGNIASVERALIQVGAAVRVTGDPDLVARARVVVFPGQGAFGAKTQEIAEGAMGAALRMVIERGDPFLGICLGMQLLFERSEEAPDTQGLAVFPGRCVRFPEGMGLEAEVGAGEAELEPAEARAVIERAQTTFEAPEPPVEQSLEAVGQPWLPAREDASANDASSDSGTQTTVAAESELRESRDLIETRTPGTEPDLEPGHAARPEHGSAVGLAVPPAPMQVSAQPEASAPEAPKLVQRLKVPHMGWNEVEPTGEHYYFVHSYYVEPARSEDVMWLTTYGSIRFPAAVNHQNVLGCQFHPEKSQRAGLKFLRAFLLGGWG